MTLIRSSELDNFAILQVVKFLCPCVSIKKHTDLHDDLGKQIGCANFPI